MLKKVLVQPKFKDVEQAIKENTEVGKSVNINYSVPKEELFADFKKEREASLKDLRAQNARTLAEVERLRDSILTENKSDVFKLRTIEQEKLDNYIADKLSDISRTNEILAEKIERDVDLTLEASYSDVVNKIKLIHGLDPDNIGSYCVAKSYIEAVSSMCNSLMVESMIGNEEE